MTTWSLLRSLSWFTADAVLFRPPAWLLIVGGLVVFSPLIEGGTTHTAAMVIRLMVLLLLCLYMAKVVREERLVLPPFVLGPSIVVFLLLAAISVAMSPYRHQSIQWLIVLVVDAGALYLLVSLMTSWGQVVWVLLLLAGVGSFETGLALKQWWVDAIARPTGTFANPNFLAGYLAAVWSILLGSLLYLKTGRGPGWARIFSARVILPLAVGGPVLLAIFLTRSRGGLLALAAGAAVVFVLRFGRKGLAALALVLALAIVIPNPLGDRLRAEHDAMNPLGYARVQMWQSAGRQMLDYPFGVGLGLYQYLYPRYAFPIEGQVARYGKVAQTPHSEYVQIGVELGAFALAVFCWGVGRVALEIKSLASYRVRRWQRGLVVGASGAVASILVHALADSNLHEPAVVMVLILCVAVLFSVKRLSGAEGRERAIQIRRPVLWGALTVLVVIPSAMLVGRMGVAWMAFEAGSHALAQRHHERAAEYLGQAVELDPGKALYRNSNAAVHFQAYQRTRDQKESAVVIDELNASIALNPLSARPFKLLGDVYGVLAAGSEEAGQSSFRLRLASAAYEQAIEREPFNPFHRLELGRLYLALAEGEEAERSVRSAVGQEPNFLPGRLWLAMRYVATDRLEPAKQEYEEILQRQRYYANWSIEPYERSFLSVDVRELAALLERSRGKKPKKNRAL